METWPSDVIQTSDVLHAGFWLSWVGAPQAGHRESRSQEDAHSYQPLTASYFFPPLSLMRTLNITFSPFREGAIKKTPPFIFV